MVGFGRKDNDFGEGSWSPWSGGKSADGVRRCRTERSTGDWKFKAKKHDRIARVDCFGALPLAMTASC